MTAVNRNIRPRRSLLFVPGLRPERFAKAVAAGADIVCIDLEDAVPRERKAEARELILPLLKNAPHPNVEPMLRINSLSTLDGLKDLQAIIESATPPAAIMIPKVRSAEEIQLLDHLLIGTAAAIRYCVIIETNQGLERVHAIAHASPRIDSLIIGAVDLSAELRCAKEWEPLLYARSRVVHAAASAGVDLLDVPFLNLEDEAGLRLECERSAKLGCGGKASIHPKQIPVIHAAFSPSEAMIERAKKVCAAFESDSTGLIVIDGELIEPPVLRSMYRVLAIAERIAQQRAS
jgi:(S)-citramalyl-CoA lyase